MRKILSMVLIFVVLISCLPGIVSASEVIEPPGEKSYSIKLENPLSLSNAVADYGNLQIKAGGEAIYGVTVPFDAVSADLEYNVTGETKLSFYVDDVLYESVLYPDVNTVNIPFSNKVSYDDHDFKITADKDVNITAITLNRIVIALDTSRVTKPRELPDITEDEAKLETTVLIGTGSNVLVVNNARRYVDYNNYKATPIVKNGTTYLPINTLARALGYYYEDKPEEGYFFLRSTYGDVEFGRQDGVFYKNSAETGMETLTDVSLYVNGATWLPVRYFAEAIGEWVEYKDGIIIIDNKYYAKELAADSELMAKLKIEFKEYKYCTSCNAEFHVAQTDNASDENSGSKEKPFRTLAKAAEMAEAGDTVIVHEGVYREVLTPQNNGTARQPIIFKAAEGEKVVLSANEVVDNFVTYDAENDIVVAAVANDLGKGKNQVFMDGEAIVEARHPNADTSSTMPQSEYRKTVELSPLHFRQGNIQVIGEGPILQAISAKAVSDTDLDQPDDFWVGGVLVSCHGYAWGLSTADIVDSTKGELTLNDFTTNFYYTNTTINDCAYITCTKNAIDMPGEWAVEDDRLYIKLPEGETKDSLKLEIKARQLVADLENSQYVQLQGFGTIGGSIKMNNSKMCVLNDMDMKYLNHHTKSKDHRDGYIDTGDCLQPGAPQRGEVGIFIGGSDNAVVNSNFNYAAGAAIYLVGTYTHIENNFINECGYAGSYVSGIVGAVEVWKGRTHPRGGYSIIQNTIRGTGRGSISFLNYDPWNSDGSGTPNIPMEVAYNDMYDNMICTRDGGMFYTFHIQWGNDKVYSKVHHNMVWNAMGDEDSHIMAIYTDNATEFVEAFNNISFNTDPTYHFNHGVAVYMQPENYVLEWNNSNLDYFAGGKDALTKEHYPEEKMFVSGCWDKQNFEKSNYGYFTTSENFVPKTDTETLHYAKYAELSDGVALNSNGAAVFSGNNQWIKFSGVKLEKGQKIVINFYGTKANTGDKFEIYCGDDLATATKINNTVDTMTVTSHSDKKLHSVRIPILPDTASQELQTVWLKITDYKSAVVEGIEVREGTPIPAEYAARVFGGDFSDVVIGDMNDPTSVALEYPNTETDDYIVNRTWPGTILTYSDVEFTEEAVALKYLQCTERPYIGKFEVRIDSLDSDPVVTAHTAGKTFHEYEPAILPLNTNIPAGTHDVYISFIESGSCNMYSIGFLKELSEEPVSEIISNKKNGIEYSTIEGGNTEKSETQLVNITPGTVLGYENVVVDGGAKVFVYSATAKLPSSGITVTVYVDSLDSDPVAVTTITGQDLDKYNTCQIPLNAAVSDGTHNIYLKFSGDETKSGNLSWFAFGR